MSDRDVPDRTPCDRDPLDDLKSAWTELEAPDGTPDRGDEQAEAALAWMRAAWHELEPPVPQIPASIQRAPAKVQVRWMAAGSLAAAALLGMVGRFVETDSGAPAQRTQNELEIARQDQAAERHQRRDANGPTSPAESPTELSKSEAAPQLLPDAPESGIVMTSGRVRLVLLTNTEDSFHAHPDSGPTTDLDVGPTKEN